MAYINGKEILFSSTHSTFEGVSQDLYDAEKQRADSLEIENGILSEENDELTAEKSEILDDLYQALQSGADGELTIPEDVTKLREYAFYRNALTKIEFRDAINTIFSYAFAYCENLQELTIPDSVTAISKSAFYGCTSLKKVKMSKNVTIINATLFSDCTNCLEYDFTGYASVPTLANVNAFNKINPNAKIKVPKALYSQWIAATNWSIYASYIEAVIDGIVSPTNDETMTMTVNTAQYVVMGFYFSDNLRSGTRCVSRTWMDETSEYEISSAEAQALLTMERDWSSDDYTEGNYEVSGQFYSGTITFKEIGTYRIYQKYYDSAGNECETGSYIFEVS